MNYKIVASIITQSLSIIIPAYNEEVRIEENLIRIDDFLNQYAPNSEMIIVNDGSSDNTKQVVTCFKRTSRSPVSCLTHKNRGKGFSVNRGMLTSTSELRLFTDADGSTDIHETLKLYIALQKFSADGSIGSRALPGSIIKSPQPFHRKITGNTLRALTRNTILPGIRDTQCGFKMFTKEFSELVFPKQTIDGFSFDLEILYLAKLYHQLVVEVPIVWEDQAGSKVDPVKESFRFIKTLGILLINRLQGQYSLTPPTPNT
ncbi:MAG: glycosyltransferase family 2 protein [Candidatus Margulisbacteria bacterium]|nr:glycosyltransferase family 2 protein [Candidatus Margulisiibacteriota bacterium]